MLRSIHLVVAAILAASSITGQAKPTNKQLTIGMTQEFETFNPLVMSMAASLYTYYMVGRPLVAIDADWNYVCQLCKELPNIEKGTAKIIEENGVKKVVANWELKPDLKWGDGTPLTAKDLKLSWEIAHSDKVSVPSKETYTRVESFAIDPKNPLKFTTKFKEARYDYFQWIVRPVPAHLESSVWAKTKNDASAYEKQTIFTTNPTHPGLSCGPYLISELKLGSHIVLKPNPHWTGKAPAIEKLIMKLIPNTQTLEASLLSGTIDMISELGMTFDQAIAFDKRVQQDQQKKNLYEVRFRDGMVYEHIDFNVRNPILADVRVRKALIHAVDRDKLSLALFEGKQKKALHNIHPLDPYYTDDVVKYDYNLKKADELLIAAGWKKGSDGIRVKDGQKLSMSIMTTAANKTRELVEVFLQQEWRKVGIDISIKNEPARVFFGETVRKAQYPAMAMYAWISSPDNPPRTTLHSAEIPTLENGWSGQNSGGWSTPEMDQLLEDLMKEFDFEKRKAMMGKVQQIYVDEVPVLPLYLRSEISVIPTNLRGFRMAGHQFYSTINIENWQLESEVTH